MLQTDTCDTLYVTKNTLVAYTIGVIQNTQTLHYDQMHMALQTAQNSASLETLLRAEQLMTAHFNLAVLSNNSDKNNAFNAQQPEATAIDVAPSTLTADDKTYPKVPSRLHSASRDTQKVQLTRAVSPTQSRDYRDNR